MGTIVGVIADTHGLLRPEALLALAGCDQIIHAGDLGGEEILEELARIAPVTAVRGNVDRAPWTRRLPEDACLTVDGTKIHVLHDRKTLEFDPAAAGIGIVISGHSHQPGIDQAGEVLYLNPGSAGRRRFSLPVTLAKLEFGFGKIRSRIIRLID